MAIMSSSKTDSGAVDQARLVLRKECARSMSAGLFTVRVRITESAGEAAEAGFYFHGVDGWKKQPERITDRKLVRALAETLDMLVSKGQGDEWSARRHKVSDGHDTDLQFHHEKFEGRLGDKLDSVLDGLLFRDSHDSKKDERHSIRTPRPATGHKS
jgi:hypothetical protein